MACLMLSVVNMKAARKQDTFQTKSGKTVTITHIKHASVQVTYDDKQFYIDPVTELAPKTDFTQYPKADFLLVTHEHFDHFDRVALATLTGQRTALYLNQSTQNKLMDSSSIVLANGDSLRIAADIKLWAVPAYNTTPDRQKFHPKGRDNGYILELDGLRIYFAGDTEDIPEMANLKNIDIAFLPCNQPYTMTVDQLVKAAKIIKPRVLFPYHFNETPVNQIILHLNGSGIDVRIRDYK